MFYGQNCSGRFGESKSIISVAGSKEDINFVRLLDELNLRKIKRELNQKYFSTKYSEKPANDKCLGTVSSADISILCLVLFKVFAWKRGIKD